MLDATNATLFGPIVKKKPNTSACEYL